MTVAASYELSSSVISARLIPSPSASSTTTMKVPQATPTAVNVTRVRCAPRSPQNSESRIFHMRPASAAQAGCRIELRGLPGREHTRTKRDHRQHCRGNGRDTGGDHGLAHLFCCRDESDQLYHERSEQEAEQSTQPDQ